MVRGCPAMSSGCSAQAAHEKNTGILLWWIPNSDLLHCWLPWRSNEQTARNLVAKSYRLEIPISFLDGFVAWYNILVTCFNGFTASQPPNPTISWILISTLRWLNFAELRQVQKCYLLAHRLDLGIYRRCCSCKMQDVSQLFMIHILLQ